MEEGRVAKRLEPTGFGLMKRDLHSGVSDQFRASKHRLADAHVLLNGARWRGSMYMAGYAVECLLKSKLMRIFQCRHLRELEDELQTRGLLASHSTVFTHQLEVLLRLTSAVDRIRQSDEVWRHFTMVNRWIPGWRYASDPLNPDDAIDFLDAVEKVSRWIENNI